MWQLGLICALKILSLLAATAQTVGFIGLFAFEALDPYKWYLLIGGTLAIAVSEGLAYLLAERWAKSGEVGG